MKRILIYCRQGYALFKPKSRIPFGGAEVDLYHLARALAKEYDIYYACEKDAHSPHLEVIQEVRVIGIAHLLKPSFLKPLAFAHLLFETLHLLHTIQPHIIIQETASFETGLLCLLKGRARFVYRAAHDMDVDGHFRKIKPWVARFYELGIRKADRVVVQTEHQRQCAWRRYRIRGHMIPNGQHIPAANSLPSIKHRNTLLWIGRIVPMKRAEYFMYLALDNPDMHFVFVGSYDRNDAYVSLIKSTLASFRNITAHWFVPWRDLPRYYRDAAFLVATSPRSGEGYPNVVVEAMKYGCPIYSIEWDRDLVISRNEVGVVFNGDLPRFRTALRQCMKDLSLRRHLSKNAFQYVARTHNIDMIIRYYKNLFNGL